MIAIDNIHFVAGWTAYQAKLPRVANPFLYLANPHRLWCLGWDCAHMCELAAMGVNHLPSDIKPTEAGLERLDKSPFAQGQVAYLKGISADDCPYEPGTEDAASWRAGHYRPLGNKVIYSDFEPARHVEKLSWLVRIVSWFAGPATKDVVVLATVALAIGGLLILWLAIRS